MAKTEYSERKRFFEIMELISKYGFSYLFSRLRIKKHPVDRGVRVRKLLEELGPTFVKLGQMLSTRYDILPLDIIQELAKLQDNVPPISYEDFCAVVQENYTDLHSVFSYIEEKALAAASIAQVHRALLYSGEEVVIKARRPKAKEIIQEDTAVLSNFVLFAQHFPFFKDFDLVGLIEDFGKMMNRELDFFNEVDALEKFNRSFRMSDTVSAPIPFREFCSENVVVMEYVPGIRFSELLAYQENELPFPVDKKKLILTGADCLFQQCFLVGFLHADPHPGNLLVTREGKLFFIDFGEVSVIDKHTRRFLLETVIALTTRDAVLLAQILTEYFPLENEDRFVLEVKSMFSKYYGKSLSDFNLGDLLLEIFKTIRKYKIRIPAQFLLMGKIILEIEGMARKLHPEFNAIQFMESFLNQHGLSMITDRFFALNEEIVWSALMLPRKIKQLSKLLDSGKINLELHSPKIERQVNGVRKSLNLLSISVIIAALLIGINNFKNQTIAYVALALLGFLIIYGILFGERRN